MRFTAPEVKGVYSFTLGVHSDSYMDADYSVDIKVSRRLQVSFYWFPFLSYHQKFGVPVSVVRWKQ